MAKNKDDKRKRKPVTASPLKPVAVKPAPVKVTKPQVARGLTRQQAGPLGPRIYQAVNNPWAPKPGKKAKARVTTRRDRTPVTPEPTPTPAPTEAKRRRVLSTLPVLSQSKADKQNKQSPRERSDDKPRDDMRCKSRPKDNRPRSGGGGGKRFIPWC